MSLLSNLRQQPEGRRLEFKESLPTNSDLVKTIIAFANDAGGELYIGINDNPRKIVGLKEDDLLALEEKIANIVHDLCEPIILPEISFLQSEGKHIIRIQVYLGSAPPYHLKSKSILEGTYIRVGSTNRLASSEIIAELERHRRNISFDSELVYSKTVEKLNITTFKDFFKEKTGEELTIQALKKMESGQSDIRNKILAPVFKKLRIIEQWGNGLKLIAEELQRYPEIAFDWKEPGLAFRVTFTNMNIKLQPELQPELQKELQQELNQESLYGLVLRILEGRQLNTKELSEKIGQKEISGQLRKIIRKLHKNQLIENLIPEKRNHPAQKHQLTNWVKFS